MQLSKLRGVIKFKKNYLSPYFTKLFKDAPLLVVVAFPPKATIRAVRIALFPPSIDQNKSKLHHGQSLNYAPYSYWCVALIT